MKKLILSLVTVSLLATMLFAFVGCGKLSKEEGISELKEAYAITRDEYANETDDIRDIYLYNEKIYEKAVLGKEGHIINRRVNINCEIDKHYNVIKDNKYRMQVSEDKMLETIDETSKITTKSIAHNDYFVGDTKDVDGNIVNAMFTTSEDYLMKAKDEKSDWKKKYVEKDITTDEIYHSDFFKPKRLMELQVMKELGYLIEHPDMLDFDIEKGGIEKKGFTTDFKFSVKDEYLTAYEKSEGKPSIYKGTHCWVQISYGRISNIYVYNDEKIGDMVLDYESYILTITYVGPKIDLPVYGEKDSKSKKNIYTDYDIYQEGRVSDGVFIKM